MYSQYDICVCTNIQLKRPVYLLKHRLVYIFLSDEATRVPTSSEVKKGKSLSSVGEKANTTLHKEFGVPFLGNDNFFQTGFFNFFTIFCTVFDEKPTEKSLYLFLSSKTDKTKYQANRTDWLVNLVESWTISWTDVLPCVAWHLFANSSWMTDLTDWQVSLQRTFT